MKNLLHRLRVWHFTHKGETLAHLTYLGAAVFEGHGIYALSAGVLGVFVVVGLLVGEH